MDDIEVLRLELKAMRIKNQALEDEVRILRRFRQLVGRASEIVEHVPTALMRKAVETDEPLTVPFAP